MQRLVLIALLIAAYLTTVASQTPQPSKIQVNGVELHYIEAGTGDTVILLHGGTGDYRSLPGPFQTLSQHYHAVSYSRRYHYPNHNVVRKNHSAYVEAEDLAALIKKLKLGRVHLVGTSYGAFTALALALKHPDLVRSMFITEPPIHSWMKGTASYKEFMTNMWDPAAAAFRQGNNDSAMRIFVDGLFGSGYFEHLPQVASSAMMENAGALKVLALSSNPFPYLPKDKLRRLNIPTMILTGANTVAVHREIDEELGRLLPNATSFTVPHAGHGIGRDNPEMFMSLLLEFLNKQK